MTRRLASLLGGAIADRVDRRRLLVLAQFGIVVAAGALAAVTLAGAPPTLVILVLGGLLAGCSSLDAVTRSAISSPGWWRGSRGRARPSSPAA